MNVPHDQQPEVCLFVAANDDPEQPSWRDVIGLLVADMAIALLALAGWAAFGWLGAWMMLR